MHDAFVGHLAVLFHAEELSKVRYERGSLRAWVVRRQDSTRRETSGQRYHLCAGNRATQFLSAIAKGRSIPSQGLPKSGTCPLPLPLLPKNTRQRARKRNNTPQMRGRAARDRVLPPPRRLRAPHPQSWCPLRQKAMHEAPSIASEPACAETATETALPIHRPTNERPSLAC